jgi:hypothetical protein
LGIAPLVGQGLDYFRLAGVWVGGIGLLYVLSGRLNANGFVFATLLDRPLVLPILGILWYFGMVAGALAFGRRVAGSPDEPLDIDDMGVRNLAAAGRLRLRDDNLPGRECRGYGGCVSRRLRNR